MSNNIPTESIKFTEARAGLSSLVDRVFSRKTRIRLYKGKTPVAAIVSIGDLDALERYEARRKQAFENMAKIAEGFKDVSPEELEAQVDAAVAQVRAERRAARLAAVEAE